MFYVILLLGVDTLLGIYWGAPKGWSLWRNVKKQLYDTIVMLMVEKMIVFFVQ